MLFAELPDNILVEIAFATGSQRDISALAKTSRRLYHVFLLPLYSINFRKHKCSAVFYLAACGYEHALSKLLYIVPQMAMTDQWHWETTMLHCLRHPRMQSTLHGFVHSPLIEPVKSGYAGVVRILLEADINPNYPSLDMRTPIAIAAQYGQATVIKTLIAYGANIKKRVQGVRRGTPLIDAAQYGQLFALRVLLDEFKRRLGTTSFAMSNVSLEAFEAAVMHDQVECLPFPVEFIGYVNFYLPGCQKTGLMLAAEKGHVGIVQYLLNVGADPNLVHGREGYTALTFAAIHGHHMVVSLLLSAGANVEHADRTGRRPLSHAAQHGHLRVTRYLAQHGADADATDEVMKRTAKEWALSEGHMRVVNFLREYQDRHGFSRRSNFFLPINIQVMEACIYG